MTFQKYGMIPNGGRCYYLNRSQPPFFIPMVKKYVDVTGDKQFVRWVNTYFPKVAVAI